MHEYSLRRVPLQILLRLLRERFPLLVRLSTDSDLRIFTGRATLLAPSVAFDMHVLNISADVSLCS
jgi:hypothetical protein